MRTFVLLLSPVFPQQWQQQCTATSTALALSLAAALPLALAQAQQCPLVAAAATAKISCILLLILFRNSKNLVHCTKQGSSTMEQKMIWSRKKFHGPAFKDFLGLTF